MNWLKTFTDYFSTTNGKIVLFTILLTAIATTILSYVIPAFGRFLRRLPKLIWMSWFMLREWFRQWRYWRRFGAIYEISFGNLQIEKKASWYESVMPFTLRVENRDDFNQMMVECKDMQFKIDSEVVKGRRIPYYLNVREDKVPTTFWIPPGGKSGDKSYIAKYSHEVKPRLGNMAFCHMTRHGSVSVGGVTRHIKVKPFPLEIKCAKVEPLASHKEDYQI